MIKDIFYSLNGNRLLKLLLEEMKISTELVRILLLLWIKLMPIKKPWMKEKDSLMVKKNLIVKSKQKMS
jgi:hypothetical protein